MKVHFALPLFAFALALPAAEVSLDFEIQPGSSTNLTYRVGSQLTNEHTEFPFQDIHQTTVAYSGNLLANATVNPSDGSIEAIEFTGGSIQTGNTTAFLSVFVSTIRFTVVFSTNGITRTASSTQLDVPDNGILDGSLHFTTLTDGILEVTNFNNNSANTTETETVNFANQTSDLIANSSLFLDGIGATTVGSAFESNSLLTQNYSAQLFCLIQVPTLAPDATIQAAGLPAQQRFRQRYFESGSLSALASYSIPSAFGQWALDQGLELSTGQEQNASGFPYTLLYALGLSSDAASLPLEFSDTTPPVARVIPPAGGLRFGIGIEYSPNLATVFAPINPNQIVGGASRLNKGNVNPIEITFPSDRTQGYLRFFSNP